MNKEIEKEFDEMISSEEIEDYIYTADCHQTNWDLVKTFIDTHFIAKKDLKNTVVSLKYSPDCMNCGCNQVHLQDLKDKLL